MLLINFISVRDVQHNLFILVMPMKSLSANCLV